MNATSKVRDTFLVVLFCGCCNNLYTVYKTHCCQASNLNYKKMSCDRGPLTSNTKHFEYDNSEGN